MIPLLLFLLVCAAVYFGTVQAAFSALMRLSLLLAAQRNEPGDRLSRFLDDPMLFFVPVRIWLAADVVAVTILLAIQFGTAGAHTVALLVAGMVLFVLVFEHLIPLLIVRGDPEAVLDALLPSFCVFMNIVRPLTVALAG